MERDIPFNKPFMSGKELFYISQAYSNSQLSGDGPFTKLCRSMLENFFGCKGALLTHSCTAALEMAAILSDISPGDEVIMPSFTFVSTANAVVLRGGVPIFIDVRPDTFNINEQLIESAISSKTKAIIPVHYAGVACEMDKINAIAKKYDLIVIEDAAQGFGSQYKSIPLGSIGTFGAVSFHETKNIISGEGGVLLVNEPKLLERAEVIREKGTNRKEFLEGMVDKYTWKDVGSSFLPGELIAAFLWAQLESSGVIIDRRVVSWNFYHDLLEPYEKLGLLRRPVVPSECKHNGHIYYVILPDGVERTSVLDGLSRVGINAVFHYTPLHNSPGGLRFGKTVGSFENTNLASSRLIRLPLWVGISEGQQERVCNALTRILQR